MDSLRSNYGSQDQMGALDSDVSDQIDIEEPNDAPPPAIGSDERRMQVRAYNFWASLLSDRDLPEIADLDPTKAGDFGPNGVVLDFSQGIEDPLVSFLGEKLASECDAQGVQVERLSDVPSRSLLSRITDHYMEIIANQAPIGFEAEFINQRGSTVLYRGILLPFSSDGANIEHIFGVINWKEMADQATADQLLEEIENALQTDISQPRTKPTQALGDWADGPGSLGNQASDDLQNHSLLNNGMLDMGDMGPMFGADGLEFGEDDLAQDNIPDDGMELAEWLARAREQADTACDREDRSRNALYEAIGKAWDFAIAAQESPDEFAEIVLDAGLSIQARAPMTPIVKLVFGATYDKTRLTEYAAALSHAKRLELGRGSLAEFLRSSDGGLKGIVATERQLRRHDSGKSSSKSRTQPQASTAKRLRAAPSQGLDMVNKMGEEFALVMVRRDLKGDVKMLGEIPADCGLLEKAARHLLGQ